MNVQSKLRARNGITLIEVLVVIAIISILASIIFPTFASAKRKAKESSGLANLSQIGKAVFLYSADNDSLFPYACSADDKFSRCAGESPLDLPLLNVALSNYVKNQEVWRHPLDTGIPNVSTSDYSEPIECQLPNTQPSLFDKYGSSYVYRSDLATEHVTDPFQFIEEASGTVLEQSQIAILYTAYGNWMGGPDVPSKRAQALYGDSHVKTSPMKELRQQGIFRARKGG